MPWQAHLYIGETARSRADVRRICADLGGVVPDFDNQPCEVILEKKVTLDGRTFYVNVAFDFEEEGGMMVPDETPSHPHPHARDYTDAIVGFALTGRYRSEILDRRYGSHGSPEPFTFDPLELQSLLDQVREWWPAAQAILWTKFH